MAQELQWPGLSTLSCTKAICASHTLQHPVSQYAHVMISNNCTGKVYVAAAAFGRPRPDIHRVCLLACIHFNNVKMLKLSLIRLYLLCEDSKPCTPNSLLQHNATVCSVEKQ